MGHHSQVNPLQRRARCWGIFRRRFPNWSDRVGPGMHTSSHQQKDGDPKTSDGHVDSPVRYTPYAIPSHHRWSNLYKQDQTMEREQKPPERMEGKRQAQTLWNWFKITIPFGIKYDKEWLLNLIQSQCSVPFTAVEFHYEKMQAQFFVENARIAFALKNVSGKIWDENDEKISIFVSPSDAPCSVQEMKPENVKQTKLTVDKRCEASQQVLDIQSLSLDANMMAHAIETVPNPGRQTITSLHFLEENIPKVKFAGAVDKEKGLKPEDMRSVRNSLCTTYLDKSSNINSILELFPKLSCLDGQQSPRPLCGTEIQKRLPTCQGSFFESDILKNLVLQFLQEYFLIYDYGDRRCLLSAYHNEACFSLTVTFNPRDPAPSSLCEYLKYNRNMTQLKDPYLCVQLLKHTKRDIADSLVGLPKTEHDFTCFVVDMWFQSEKMLCFSVNGVFREVEGNYQGCVCAFMRTFIAIPGSNSSLCIVNDKLFVRDASSQGNQSAFPISMPMPTPAFTSVPAPSQELKRMVQPFSIQSRMNLACSQKYLHDNHYDYTRAVQALTLPMAKGKTPEESLAQIHPGS